MNVHGYIYELMYICIFIGICTNLFERIEHSGIR